MAYLMTMLSDLLVKSALHRGGASLADFTPMKLSMIKTVTELDAHVMRVGTQLDSAKSGSDQLRQLPGHWRPLGSQ